MLIFFLLVLDYPAFLLGVNIEYLKTCLLSREMEDRWGGKAETLTVTFTTEQAASARDALSKEIYDRLFDWIVKVRDRLTKSGISQSHLLRNKQPVPETHCQRESMTGFLTGSLR